MQLTLALFSKCHIYPNFSTTYIYYSPIWYTLTPQNQLLNLSIPSFTHHPKPRGSISPWTLYFLALYNMSEWQKIKTNLWIRDLDSSLVPPVAMWSWARSSNYPSLNQRLGWWRCCTWVLRFELLKNLTKQNKIKTKTSY